MFLDAKLFVRVIMFGPQLLQDFLQPNSVLLDMLTKSFALASLDPLAFGLL